MHIRASHTPPAYTHFDLPPQSFPRRFIQTTGPASRGYPIKPLPHPYNSSTRCHHKKKDPLTFRRTVWTIVTGRSRRSCCDCVSDRTPAVQVAGSCFCASSRPDSPPESKPSAPSVSSACSPCCPHPADAARYYCCYCYHRRRYRCCWGAWR